jgi:site-specific DNA recombinase
VKAALYARFSTEKQSEASIEDQFRVCERIAEREGFSVVARFSDAAVSGGTTSRPGYQALLRAARKREIGIIVAEDSSRLWRELAEQWRALKELQDLGVHVVGHGLDTRREESKILLAVNGAVAEGYRDEIARRTRRGLEGRAREGKSAGGRAYGYVPPAMSATGNLEIEPQQAEVVRQIFTWYAEGWSSKAIAAELNQRGVPSPGSKWHRTKRRSSGWLFSAIAGDTSRGLGILNNDLYRGRVVWNRARWIRSAADSSKRRCVPNPPSEWVTREDESLRVVSDELWRRVKARQTRQRHSVGARIKGALPRHAPGQGRPPRHLLSGLLRCAVCDASFTMADARAYACASYVNGAACENRIRVARTLIESRILDNVKADLRDPEVITEVERRVTHALAARTRSRPADNRARIEVLKREIANLTDAIAGGLLKASPALAQRLAAAETELERLQAAASQVARAAPIVARIIPMVAERWLSIVTRLEQPLGRNPANSRTALIEAIGSTITLQPDASRRFLWAEYGLEGAQMLVAVGVPEIMVAGAGFEPATFGL